MGQVNVSDLKDGMVVLTPVSNKHGNVLLKKGDTLAEKNIVLLKSWGITEVDIESSGSQQVEEADNDALSPEIVAAIDKEVQGMFSEFKDNPLMEKLYGIIKKAKLQSAVENISGQSNETGPN